jgi:hypothetical protein
MYNEIINVGMYGPIFMTIIAIWQLYYLPKYLIWFFVFLWINESIIIFAKKIIRQPRPGERILTDSQNDEYGYYGMPSGHALSFDGKPSPDNPPSPSFVPHSGRVAQHTLFIMSFVWLVNPSWAVLCVYIVITGITLLERYNNKRHTLEQLFVGGISGCIIAYISVMIMRKYYEYK